MKVPHTIAFVVLVALSVTGSVATAKAQGQLCTVGDLSYALNEPSQDNCGTVDWILQVVDRTGQEWDFGSQTSVGTCTGNYTDCDGVYHPPNVITSGYSFQSNPSGDTENDITWTLSNYSTATNSCPAGSPNPSGSQQVAYTPNLYEYEYVYCMD